MWEIIQTPEFDSWNSLLSESTREDIYANIKVLSVFGPGLGRPRVDSIKNSKHIT